ncbi:MAG TPA: histidinol-phosphatase [Candidatus Binatia bacterium]|nr:histidinol-phosphatase [Candidatus Binatia bacterium]
MQHDTARFLSFADTLADAARGAILPHFRTGGPCENKSADGFDPVTAADRASEAAMRALIEREFPEHGVLGEEFARTRSRSGYEWVLDPIDGTRAFIAGLPTWGVLIALAYEGKPIVGVMDQPYLDERYRGWNDGADSFVRGVRRTLKTRNCARLSDAILSTTSPDLFHGAEAEAFARARAKARLTRYGFDCYAYSMVAAGHMDCVIESGLKPFDIQALIPILAGAGGGVCSWRGGDAAQGGQVLAFSDARLRDETLALLERAA